MNNKGPDERIVVLLLEEETMEREAFSEYLERAGYAVLGACDCDEALSVLEERPDVRALVTDAHVPGCMDGFELAEVARTRWPHLAVVMMSGHSDATSGPIPEGAEFIGKPYLLSQLAPTLRRMTKAA
jgi:DNA-binding NtrC family response regulator